MKFVYSRMELTMTNDDAATGRADDAIEILKNDHLRMQEQFKEFATLGPIAPLATRIALVQDICTSLTIHSAIEEEFFDPAVRTVIHDDELINKAEIEHASARYLIEQLLPVELDDEYFEAKLKVLREYTKHHSDEEEGIIFPKVRQTRLDLVTLGRQMLDRKLGLQGELATPAQLTAFMASHAPLRSRGTGVAVMHGVMMEKNRTDDTAAEHNGGAIDVLTDDHNRVRNLFGYFAQLEGSGPTAERITVAEEICKELVVHTTIEEELFYPAVRVAIDDRELINEAEVEHGGAKYLIQQLLPVEKDDLRFCAKIAVLREYVKHHMDEEEKKIFPRVKQANFDLIVVGQMLMDRREELRNRLKTAEQIVGFEPVKYFVGRPGAATAANQRR